MVESAKTHYIADVLNHTSGEQNYVIASTSSCQKLNTDKIDRAFNRFCSHCNLTFENFVEYEHHNVEMHGHKKLLTCSFCSASFKRQDHLNRHLMSLHSNQRYCRCPVCSDDFPRKDVLLAHIEDKHSDGVQIFNCRLCTFSCNGFEDLEKHEDLHISTDRRALGTHKCAHCNTTFKRRDHMLRHVKSQHLGQVVVCPLCSQTYKRKDHLVRHVREIHKMGFLCGKLVKSSDIL